MEEDAKIIGNTSVIQVEGNDIDIVALCKEATDACIQKLVIEKAK